MNMHVPVPWQFLFHVVWLILLVKLTRFLIESYTTTTALGAYLRTYFRGSVINGSVFIDKMVNAIKSTPLPNPAIHPENQHGDAAASRTSAVLHQKNVIDSQGYDSYDLSCSRTTMKRGDPGERMIYDVKDLGNHTDIRYPNRNFTKNTMIIMNDVLDHMTEKETIDIFSSDAMTSSYDFQLSAPSGRSFGTTYRFDDGMWHFTSADTSYKQKVWRFGNEAIAVVRTKFLYFRYAAFVSLCLYLLYPYLFSSRDGYPSVAVTLLLLALSSVRQFVSRDVTVRKIVRVGMAENRVINYTIPVTRMSYAAYLTFWKGTMDEAYMTRLEPTLVKSTKNDYYLMSGIGLDGILYHWGCLVGTSTSRFITDSDLSILRVRCVQKNVSPGGLVILANELDLPSCKSNVSFDMFLDIARATEANRFPDNSRFTFVPRAMGIYTVGPTPNDVTMPPKLPPTQFMQPVVPDMLYPSENPRNLAYGYSERVAKQRSALNIKPKYYSYAREFFSFMYPAHLALASEAEVRERQNRPTQRRILDDAEAGYGPNYNPLSFAKEVALRCFGKKEPVSGINGLVGNELKPKRIITTFEGETKFYHSRITIPMSAALKQCHWYVFGKSMEKVSEQVTNLCTAAYQEEGDKASVLLTDLSKMDGCVNEFFRNLDDLRDKQAWPPHIAEEIISTRHTSFNRKTRLPGLPVKNGTTELGSGHPDTSLGQSTRAAYMEYVALRETGFEPEVAYSRIGLHGGDDGLSRFVDPALYNAVVTNMGMKLKVKTVTKHQALGTIGDNVEFLGRVYSPQVFHGDNNSMSDPYRTLSQFPYSNSGQSRDTIARTKAYAISLNDGNTPFIGPLVNKMLLSLNPRGTIDRTEMSYNASRAEVEGSGYPNAYGDWMLDVCTAKGITGTAEWDAFIQDKSSDWSLPPMLVVSDEVAPAVNAFVDGVMHNVDLPPPEIVSLPPDIRVLPPADTAEEVLSLTEDPVHQSSAVPLQAVALPIPCRDFGMGRCTRRMCNYSHVPPGVVVTKNARVPGTPRPRTGLKQKSASANQNALRARITARATVVGGRPSSLYEVS